MMELWLDTVDFELITKANNTLQLAGVTTNPTILSKSNLPIKETVEKLLTIQSGLVAIQVTATDKQNIIIQAKKLAAINRRIIVKIPATEDGFFAIHHLAQLHIPTMATAIFEPGQILLSILAGATYAAPYLSKISPNIMNCYAVIYEMVELILAQNSALKLIAAAIQNKQQIIESTKAKVNAITIPSSVYQELITGHPATSASLGMFQKDWGTLAEIDTLV